LKAEEKRATKAPIEWSRVRCKL